MTNPDPWPLLAAIEALLSRDKWPVLETVGLELRIAQETSVGMEVCARWICGGRTEELREAAPFLRSRDAAALLEAQLPAHEISVCNDIEGWTAVSIDRIAECGQCRTRLADDVLAKGAEAAARTSAALEAGWRLGIWPVKA